MTDAGIKFSTNGDYSNFDAVENLLYYIFQFPTATEPDRKPLPIHFYGLPYMGYPPQINDLISQCKVVRQRQSSTISRQFWHFQITFPVLFSSLYESYFYFADRIARIFCLEYPVFYAYHTKNRNTGNHHSHFHFAVLTSSYIPEYPALDAERFVSYLVQIPDIAQQFGIRISYLQSQEELACLSLAMIF